MQNLSEKERQIILNQETGKIAWSDLQIHFARGLLIKIDPALDLVTVADKFIMDDTAQLKNWYDTALISRSFDETAARYSAEQTMFWAIVVAPWVLVQEITLK